MNSFSKTPLRFLFLTSILLLWSPSLPAIMISGIYTGACEQRLGVILNVDSYSLKFLNLNGKVENLPRHQVIQVVSYVSDEIPFSTMQIDLIPEEEVPAFEISTIKNLSEYPLVKGYPIDFTEDKIAFLTETGREVLIDKKSILHISRAADFQLKPHPLKRAPPKFAHAYAFAQCDKNKDSEALLIYPGQILAEPLTIKRDLDRLQKGFELVARYMDEQDFYPQPIVYPSQTRLGMWYSFGSRYGMSSSRNNNYTPVLNSGYVSDIYDFQRIIVTGSQPNFLFEHEEAQTQAFYAFKASYFHFAAYFDPSLILVGSNAIWNSSDLSVQDMKLFSTNGMGFGFDRNHWQIGFMSSTIDLALQSGSHFYEGAVGVSKFHLVWSHYRQKFELLSGDGGGEDFSGVYKNTLAVRHWRFNYERTLTERLKSGFSLIETRANLNNADQNIHLSAQTQSASTLLQYTFAKRYNVDTMISVEKLSTTDPLGARSQQFFFKAGSSVHLFF